MAAKDIHFRDTAWDDVIIGVTTLARTDVGGVPIGREVLLELWRVAGDETGGVVFVSRPRTAPGLRVVEDRTLIAPVADGLELGVGEVAPLISLGSRFASGVVARVVAVAELVEDGRIKRV